MPQGVTGVESIMKEKYRQQWENLGDCDPYWAVLSDPEKKGSRWEDEAFFRTGQEEIAELFDKLSALGSSVHAGVALDYGCGVGRLSRFLAPRFAKVLAVDFSAPMIAEAKAANAGLSNIEFRCTGGTDLAEFADASVDFIYSNMVLQHSPKSTQVGLIREFCRVLRPGGTLVFQTPSHQNLATLGGLAHALFGNACLNLASRLRHGKARVMEMHNLKSAAVLRLLQEAGLTLVERERFDAAGRAFVSYRYFATK